MSNKTRKFLWCKLKESVVTEENDFIPAGTPVQVMGWSDVTGEEGFIECRAECYMFVADGREKNKDWTGDINSGLLFAVDPSNLVYETYNEVEE